MSELVKDDLCKSLGSRRDTIALVGQILGPAEEDVKINELQAPVADVGPGLESFTPLLGSDLAGAKRIRALGQPLGRNSGGYAERFALVGGL